MGGSLQASVGSALSWRSAEKPERKEAAPTHQLGWTGDCLPFPTPSLRLISSPVMMREGNLIVLSVYHLLAWMRLATQGETLEPPLGAALRRTVRTRWSVAKFKHTVADSSSQQWHYPWSARAPQEESSNFSVLHLPFRHMRPRVGYQFTCLRRHVALSPLPEN